MSGIARALRAACALAVCIAPPIVAIGLLRPQGPSGAIFVYCAVAFLLAAARFVPLSVVRQTGRGLPPGDTTSWLPTVGPGRTRFRLAVDIALAAWLVAGALVVFAGLDITPASTIIAWLKVAREGGASGVISYLFVAIIALFCSLSGAMLLLRADPLPVALDSLFVALFLAGVILGRTGLSLAALGAAALSFGYRAFRAAGRRKLRLLPGFEVLAAALILAAAFFPLKPHNPLFEAPFALDLKPLIARLSPTFPFLYGLPGYGYSFPGESLGGRPALTARPVFEVKAHRGETLYLRSAVYDSYTGQGWAASGAAEEAGKTAARELPVVSAGRTARLGAPGEPEARIKLLIDFFPALPSTLGTTGFVVEQAPLPSQEARPSPATPASFAGGTMPLGPLALSEASLATGFLLDTPLLAGTVITEERGTASPFGPDLPELRTDLAVEKPPRELVELAGELSRGRSKRETVAAIKAYLASRCVYSLETSAPRLGGDLVAQFLFRTRKGYCVQFATSFVVLARLAGIPTRYVTGFLVNIPEDSAQTTVTGMSAHAWAESWLGGRWVTEEATPPMAPSALGEPDYWRRFNPGGDPYTLRQLEAAMAGRVEAPRRAPKPAPRLPLALIPGVAALLAAIAFAGRALVRLLQPAPAKARREVRQLIELSARRALPDPARRGWRAWVAAAVEAIGAAGRPPESGASLRRSHVERAGRIVLLLGFGGRRARARDSRYLREVRRRLARVRTPPSPLHHRDH